VTDNSRHEFDASQFDADTMSGQIRPIRRVVFALGSNVGDRLSNLQEGMDSLLDAPGIHAVTVSPVYETEPVGGPEQDDFYNAVLIVDTDLPSRSLLERCLAVEAAYGRERDEPSGPRTLDIDIIVVADRRANDPDFTLPHPRAHERAFVLAPWLAADPEAELPGHGSVRSLLAALGTSGVIALDGPELKLPE
jgi:2-amino-4-hydroxy-6-hydroxymethyldihydropteridine diphosphokinase